MGPQGSRSDCSPAWHHLPTRHLCPGLMGSRTRSATTSSGPPALSPMLDRPRGLSCHSSVLRSLVVQQRLQNTPVTLGGRVSARQTHLTPRAAPTAHTPVSAGKGSRCLSHRCIWERCAPPSYSTRVSSMLPAATQGRQTCWQSVRTGRCVPAGQHSWAPGDVPLRKRRLQCPSSVANVLCNAQETWLCSTTRPEGGLMTGSVFLRTSQFFYSKHGFHMQR